MVPKFGCGTQLTHTQHASQKSWTPANSPKKWLFYGGTKAGFHALWDSQLICTIYYGIDVVVLDPAYVAPGTDEMLGIKARVKVGGGAEKGGLEFDVFQFRADVYERCAREAGLDISWKGVVVPDDERAKTGYWDGWLSRPTFAMLEAKRIGK
ncbi:hypothetical protein EJ07DRAFT_151562 [Lizonia empirigonia]|nr:hypothetical protein EJ07DRAFT_151562 [Lizonia empirigonia]